MDENQLKALKLEQLLIASHDWHAAPDAARDIALRESAEGVPTGIAYDPSDGWFVIQSSGQGPYIIWSEA